MLMGHYVMGPYVLGPSCPGPFCRVPSGTFSRGPFCRGALWRATLELPLAWRGFPVPAVLLNLTSPNGDFLRLLQIFLPHGPLHSGTTWTCASELQGTSAIF